MCIRDRGNWGETACKRSDLKQGLSISLARALHFPCEQDSFYYSHAKMVGWVRQRSILSRNCYVIIVFGKNVHFTGNDNKRVLYRHLSALNIIFKRFDIFQNVPFFIIVVFITFQIIYYFFSVQPFLSVVLDISCVVGNLHRLQQLTVAAYRLASE